MNDEYYRRRLHMMFEDYIQELQEENFIVVTNRLGVHDFIPKFIDKHFPYPLGEDTTNQEIK